MGRGPRPRAPRVPAGGSALVALAGITKYFGVALVPLLLVYALIRRRRPGAWLLALLLPIAVFDAYHAATRALALSVSALLAVAVAWADQRWANQVRATVRDLGDAHVATDRTTYFQGRWGFQHSMQEAGARALDFRRDVLAEGDLLVLPLNDTNVRLPDRSACEGVAVVERAEPKWLRTLDPGRAGFYASSFGALPFAFGRARPDVYQVWRARRSFHFQKGRVERSGARSTTPEIRPARAALHPLAPCPARVAGRAGRQ